MIQVQPFVFNAFQENSYVLYDAHTLEAIVIDPGMYEARERQSFDRFVQEKKLQLKAIYNTHTHIDHIFGNRYVQETYNIPVFFHEKDLPNYQPLPFVASRYGLEDFQYFTDYQLLTDKDKGIHLGAHFLDILFVPGHSPGHVAFYSAAQNFVIGGDVLFRMSIGRTDFPNCNHQDLLHSIRQVFFKLPDDTLVYSGHGQSTTIGFEKTHNPFLV